MIGRMACPASASFANSRDANKALLNMQYTNSDRIMAFPENGRFFI